MCSSSSSWEAGACIWPAAPRTRAGTWTAQQARQLAWSLSERLTPIRFLVHDRDSKFSRVFDEVFRSDGVEIIRTPFRAPQANAFAERWVGTVRRDCLDWVLITSRRQLERVLRVYVDHYNTHRPHRTLGLTPPIAGPSQPPRRFQPAKPAPATRQNRRTDPRIRPSSMTDGFAYPTGLDPRPGARGVRRPRHGGAGGGGAPARRPLARCRWRAAPSCSILTMGSNLRAHTLIDGRTPLRFLVHQSRD